MASVHCCWTSSIDVVPFPVTGYDPPVVEEAMNWEPRFVAIPNARVAFENAEPVAPVALVRSVIVELWLTFSHDVPFVAAVNDTTDSRNAPVTEEDTSTGPAVVVSVELYANDVADDSVVPEVVGDGKVAEFPVSVAPST
ncbi:MAG: hypothetical protein L3J81_04195, partial [Thermoplasmata archaeon]|nr:hypothetical protein [Thermoplasmata archaeon]